MAKTDFPIYNIKREYVVTLCTSNKDKIAILPHNDLTFSAKHKDFNTLEFKIPHMLDGVIKIENKNFNLVKTTYLIFLQIKDNDTVVHEEYFTLNVQKDKDNNGKYNQTITCDNLAFTTFNDKILRGYKNKGSQLLWDRNGNNGILNVLLNNLYNTWTVAYMDTDMDNIYHEFEFDKSTYIDVIKQCEKDFNCSIIFDTVNNTISIDPGMRFNLPVPNNSIFCYDFTNVANVNQNQIIDISGNGRNGEMSRVMFDSSGAIFNGVSSMIEVLNSSNVNYLTMECMLSIDNNNSLNEGIIMGKKGNDIYQANAIFTTPNADDNLVDIRYHLYNKIIWKQVTKNNYHHIVVTYDGRDFIIYSDGVKIESLHNSNCDLNEPIWIGCAKGLSLFLKANMKIASAYSDGWTPEQVANRYAEIQDYFNNNNTGSINSNTNIMFTDENFIKSLSIKTETSQLKTRLYVYGKNGVDISRYNPLGSRVENLDYFYNNGFSESLKTAWTTYQSKVDSLTPDFEDLVTNLDLNTSSLNTKKAELAVLNTELKAIQIHMDGEMKKSEYLVNTPLYDYYYPLQQEKLTEISTKQSEIDTINNNINTITTNMTSIRNQLTYENNFTLPQLQELIPFIKEDTLELSTVSNAKLLYQYAQHYLTYKSILPITFNIDSIDLFNQMDLQRIWNKIKCGNKFIIHCPKLGYNMVEITLMSLTHNPFSNSLNLEFSNTEELNNQDYRLQKLLVNIDRMTANVEVNKDSYAKYELEKDDVLKASAGVDLTKTEIKAGDDNVITQRGFIGNDIGSDGAISIKSDKIICSTDNWLTYYTLLSSNGLHLITKDGKHRIIIHPVHGFQIDKLVLNSQTNKYEWTNVVYMDTEGNFTMEGIYKNIKNGTRIEIDSLGLSSKNDTNQLHGVSLKNQGNSNGYDQLGWYKNNDLQCFAAYNQEGNFEIGTVEGQSIYLLTSAWLYLMANKLRIGEDATSEINIYGNVSCINAKFSNLKNENSIPYITNDVFANKYTGTFTDQAGITHNVVNGLITT